MIAKRLLDQLKLQGFAFHRIAPGPDGPLVGQRTTGNTVDTIWIEGFSHDCAAWRTRTSSLIIPGGGRVECRVDGSALKVLHEVLTWETVTPTCLATQSST